jgi:uncharacterized membrane protein
MDDTRRFRPQRIFLALAWTFGTLFVFLTPPFQAPDEYDHFYRAYQVSQGHLTQTWNGNQAGGFLPKSLIEFQDRVSANIPHHLKIKQSLAVLWAMRKIPLRAGEREFVAFPWYAPTNYFPQAAGIAVARWLGAGPLILLYAGRLGNLLAWSLLIYLALRLIPFLQWTLALLALMPMSLFLAASLSADAMVNGLCFLFVAAVLRCAVGDERPITAARMGGMIFLGAAIALAKTAYVPLVLLTLMIPAGKYGGRRRYWLAFTLLLAVSAAVTVGWALYTYRNFVNPDSSPLEQLVFRLHHPLATARYYIGQLFSIAFLCSIVGKLGWYDTPLWRPMVAAYVVMLVWATRKAQVQGQPEDRPEAPLSGRQRAIIALAAAATWLAVFALVDLAFTRVGGVGISSLQGRYLIPVTPLVFLLLYPADRSGRQPRRQPAPLIAGFSACFCIYTALVLIRRFYIS